MKAVAILLPLVVLTLSPGFAEDRIDVTVVGPDKAPIAGARVILLDSHDSIETKTSGDGKTSVPAEPKPGTFFLVGQDGYHFHGELLEKAGQDRVLTLTPASQSSLAPLKGADWDMSREERTSLFKELLDPYLDHVLELQDDREKLRPLETLATFVPERALEILDTKPLAQKQFGEMVKARAMEGLASHDPDAALDLAESFEGAYVRCYSLIDITRRAADMPKDQKRELLIRAAGDARSIKNPGQRVGLIGVVAGALMDAGESVAAEKLLRETQAAAQELPRDSWASFARGSFAERLMVFDPQAAVSMISGLAQADSRNRHFGNAAHRLAATNPKEAERVLNMIERVPESRYVIDERDQYAPRVCFRLANQDLARAKKIAGSCAEVNFQAYSLGLIAHALGPERREEATKLLREAFDLLENGIRDATKVKIQASSIAGALLPSVEYVDPGLVREMFWRTVSLRTAESDEPGWKNWSDELTAYLAAWLSRYDRDVSGAVLQHWHSQTHQPHTRDHYAVALALSSPAKAAEFAKSLDEPGQPSSVRHSVAKQLLLEGTERLRVPHRMPGIWPIDADDIAW